MPEVFAFPEGKLYLWYAYSGYWSAYLTASGTGSASASAIAQSGSLASGTALAFAQDATLTFAYGWIERYHDDGTYRRSLSGQRADLNIGHMLSDQATYNLAQSKSAMNATFEGYISGTQQTARWTLYSGVIDNISINQAEGALFNSKLSYHAYEWSATGG